MSSKKEEQKKRHDLKSAIAFLENLHEEIKIASSLQELQDPLLLDYFQQVILTIKQET